MLNKKPSIIQVTDYEGKILYISGNDLYRAIQLQKELIPIVDFDGNRVYYESEGKERPRMIHVENICYEEVDDEVPSES